MDAARGRSRALRAVTVAALVTLATVGVAAASEGPPRSEYVASLERICKPNALATQRAMKGARADLSAERLAVVARKFAQATRLFGSTVATITAVPRPAADVTALRKWFSYLKRQEAYLKRITAQLRAGRAVPAQRLTARFIHNGNLANNVVLAFGFNYCRFKFSRYG